MLKRYLQINSFVALVDLDEMKALMLTSDENKQIIQSIKTLGNIDIITKSFSVWLFCFLTYARCLTE